MNELYTTENYLTPILVLDYNIDAEINAVYDAWTQIDTFKKWFCPTGFTVALAEMNALPGGFFRVHMQSPDGEIYPTKGEYILLEKPNQIVYCDSWDDDRQDNEPITTEIRFANNGDKTTISLYSSFATHEQKETVLNAGVVEGWKMFLNNLKECLK